MGPDVDHAAFPCRGVADLGSRQPDHRRARQDGHIDPVERLDPVDVRLVAMVAGPAEVAQGERRAGGLPHVVLLLPVDLRPASVDATPAPRRFPPRPECPPPVPAKNVSSGAIPAP